MPPNGGNFSGPKYIEAYNAERWFEPRVREIQWWLQREAFNFKSKLFLTNTHFGVTVNL